MTCKHIVQIFYILFHSKQKQGKATGQLCYEMPNMKDKSRVREKMSESVQHIFVLHIVCI